MLDKVIAYINEQQMIQEGDGIIIGVSGGADSVCLLLLLHDLRTKYDLTLRVVHIEHGIRGELSIQDAEFVKQLCKKLDVDFRMYSYQVEQYAREHRLTVEEAGRKLRYETFAREAQELQELLDARREYPSSVRIAVAHNANDNAETMLFHLSRGSGIDGLCGIPAMRENIIRPLLAVSRSEIEAYLQEMQQEYHVDATNADLKYHRNKIRHQVLPVLEEINPQAVQHITAATDSLQEIADYLNGTCEQVLQQVCVEDTLDRNILATYPPVIRKKVLHRWISQYANGGKDITAVHIRAVAELLSASIGKSVDLPYGLRVESMDGTLRIYHRRESGTESDSLAAGLQRQGISEHEFDDGNIPYMVMLEENLTDQRVETTIGKYRICYQIIPWNKSCVIPQKTYTKYFDYDKIKSNLAFRYRSQGDYFTVTSELGTKKFKDYCINEKISRNIRDQILLLCEGHHILWAIGYRISEKYKVDETTQKVLTVQIMEEKENE